MASYTDRAQGFWVNEPVDEPLGIVKKYYPRFLVTYNHNMLHANKSNWVMTACVCTDGKYYVFDRNSYRIGPFDTLDTALFAAAALDGRDI